MKTLNLCVDSWIIQDGNYSDFFAGQHFNCAVEFYPHSIASALADSPYCSHVNSTRYKIRGKVVYRTNEVWVIDFGLLVFQKISSPDFAAFDTWVEGEILLSVDPFFYREELWKLPELPDLTYSFAVDRIFLETTPWITVKDEFGREMNARDQTQESFQEVKKTDAWHDDGGHAAYWLECTMLPRQH